MATKQKEVPATRIKIPCRFSYVHVFEPHKMNDQSKAKYSVSLLIPKKDKATIAKINAAIKAAIEADGGKKLKGEMVNGKYPKKWKMPLRDGDEDRPEDESYIGMMFLSANSDLKPGVVDETVNTIGADEFYSGCYGRAAVNFYVFGGAKTGGSMGVACGLGNLQKLKDGERLSGGASAEDDFADDEEL